MAHSEHSKGHSEHGKAHGEHGKGHHEHGKSHAEHGKGHSEHGKAHPDHGKSHAERAHPHHAKGHPLETPLHRHSAVAAAVFLFAGLVAWWGVHEPGTWVHIKTGERILAEGALPETDSFSQTSGGKAWTTESWLADVLFHKLHEGWPVDGPAALKSAAAAAAFASLAPINHGHPLLAGAVLCLGAAASWPQLTELPGVFDLLMLALFIRLLRARPTFRWSLGWAAVLELAWANLNGASALMGVWLVALKVIRAAGRTGHRDLPKYFAVLGLTVAAWLCNPHGWNLFPYVSTAAAPPSSVWSIGLWGTPYTVLAASGLAAAWVCLQTEFFLAMTTASLAGFSLLFPGLRAVGILASCPTIALALGHWVSRREVRPWRALKWAAAPALLLAWHWTAVRAPLSGAAGYGAFDAGGAAAFLKAQGVRGIVFNEPVMGDFLIGAGRPVFADSRRLFYGDDFLREAADWPGRWKTLQDVYRPDYAVLRNRRVSYPARVLDENPSWRLAYADDRALVYLKTSGANAWLVANAPRRLAAPNRLWPDSLDAVLKNPKQVFKLLEELDRWIVQSPDSVQALLWKAYALDRLSLSEKAERFLELAMERERLRSDPELSALAGFVLEKRNQKGSARAAYHRAAGLSRRLGDRRLEAAVLDRLVWLHREWGHDSIVRRIEERVRELEQEAGR